MKRLLRSRAAATFATLLLAAAPALAIEPFSAVTRVRAEYRFDPPWVASLRSR